MNRSKVTGPTDVGTVVETVGSVDSVNPANSASTIRPPVQIEDGSSGNAEVDAHARAIGDLFDDGCGGQHRQPTPELAAVDRSIVHVTTNSARARDLGHRADATCRA